MKSKYKIFAFATLPWIMGACSSVIPEPQIDDDVIRFVDPFTQKNVSRALGDITNSNFSESKFKVWGTATAKDGVQTTVFNGTEVYNNNGVWEYDDPQKWESDKTYSFVAIAPTDVMSGYSYSNDKFTIQNIPLSVEANEGIDYLVSNRQETGVATDGVQLEFKHILSRLKLGVKCISDDEVLESVTLKRVEINLPDGRAQYEQASADGPTEADVWTRSENAEYKTYGVFDGEKAVTSEGYEALGDGFFVVPQSEGLKVTMNLSYSIVLNIDGKAVTKDVDKIDVEIPNLDSFRQGYVNNLLINIKPAGSDYAYIQINVEQVVADHEPDNGYINDKGEAFLIKGLMQSNNQLVATIDALGNEVVDGAYRLVSVLDASGVELLNQENTFALSGIDEDGCYMVSAGVNALLDADNEYTFVIADKFGNTQQQSLALTSDLGGASMQWTIKIDESSYGDRTFAIPFNTSGVTSFTYRIDWGDGNVVDVPKGTSFSSKDDFLHQYSQNDTYKIKITSAIGDYNSTQIDPFAFGAYRGSSNGDQNYGNIYRLISIDTPLLNMGRSAAYIFRGCTKLETVPKNCFIYNEALESLEGAFYGSGIVSVPQGIFDNLVNVECFGYVFNKCTKLCSVPTGLFAKNLKAYDFSYCFSLCGNIELNQWLFISNDSEKATRFAFMTTPIDFTSSFKNCSNDLTASTTNNLPELWEYTYGAGYTWKTNDNSNKYNPFYNISQNKYKNGDSIPEEWLNGDAEGYGDYIKYPYSY